MGILKYKYKKKWNMTLNFENTDLSKNLRKTQDRTSLSIPSIKWKQIKLAEALVVKNLSDVDLHSKHTLKKISKCVQLVPNLTHFEIFFKGH